VGNSPLTSLAEMADQRGPAWQRASVRAHGEGPWAARERFGVRPKRGNRAQVSSPFFYFIFCFLL
jgi:hypothetical protein